MKKQIRRGVFETNSSSVHSITMCSQDEYSRWERGELLFDKYHNKFVDSNKVEEYKKENIYLELVDEQGYWNDVDYETFSEEYVTPNGEKVVAFGYYGADY
jgi:hypothetical protein